MPDPTVRVLVTAADPPRLLARRHRRPVGCADCEQPLPGPDAYTALLGHLDRCPTAPGRDLTGMAHA